MTGNVILLIYGSGGHREQMKRLYAYLEDTLEKNTTYIGLCENGSELDRLTLNYSVVPARDKFSVMQTAYKLPLSVLQTLYFFITKSWEYDIKAVISTGPGIAVFPAIIAKMMRKKVVFIETWSRFTTASITGKIMYHLADEFYIQNRSLQKIYPKARYCGLL